VVRDVARILSISEMPRCECCRLVYRRWRNGLLVSARSVPLKGSYHGLHSSHGIHRQSDVTEDEGSSTGPQGYLGSWGRGRFGGGPGHGGYCGCEGP
jgi:hypothetical protein